MSISLVCTPSCFAAKYLPPIAGHGLRHSEGTLYPISYGISMYIRYYPITYGIKIQVNGILPFVVPFWGATGLYGITISRGVETSIYTANRQPVNQSMCKTQHSWDWFMGKATGNPLSLVVFLTHVVSP